MLNDGSKVAVVIFSKNRSMQLDALLATFRKYISDYDLLNLNLDINIIFKADENHKHSYWKLQKEWSAASIRWIEENNFKNDILGCLKDKEFVVFLCDDAILTRKFEVEELCGILNNTGNIYSQNLIGVSLRLGTNTNKCYSLGKDQKIPDYIEFDDDKILWDWSQAEYDMGYPLELSSSLYKVQIVLPMIENYQYKNPNDLEWVFYRNAPGYMNFKPYLMSYKTSIAFCNPCNKTQTVNNNRVGSNVDYSADALLKLYEDRYRIDIERFDGFVSNGAHMEVPYDFVRMEL